MVTLVQTEEMGASYFLQFKWNLCKMEILKVIFPRIASCGQENLCSTFMYHLWVFLDLVSHVAMTHALISIFKTAAMHAHQSAL